MSGLQHLITSKTPEGWRTLPFWSMFQRVKFTNHPEEELLSVYRDYGVIPKSSRDDNHNKESEDLSNYQLVDKGWLVTNKMKAWQGSVAISRYRGIVSPAYYAYKPLSKENDQFLHYLLRSELYIALYQRISKGVRVNQWDLEHEALRNIPILIPDKQTQKEIADFLDRETARIDQLIDRKRRLINVLEEKYSNIINKTVRQGIDHQIDIKPVELQGIEGIPEHWEIKKLRHLGNLQNGISEGADYFGEGYPFVGYGDIYNHFSLPDNVSGLAQSTELDRKRYSVIRGDVFFTRTSEVAEEIGISSLCLKTIDNATFSGFVIRFRPNTKDLLPEFSKYYFRSDIPRVYFIKEMNLVTRVSLSQNLLKSLPVIVPPIDEQEKIAEYLDKKSHQIDKLINDVESSIKSLSEFRISLITEAVTGQLDINAWKQKGGADKRLDTIEEAMAS